MTNHRDGKPIDILLVEDNPGDIRLTELAFEDGCINNNLHVATDGKEALDFLYRREAHETAPRPDIVLLDLNLPKIDGHQVLREIKTDDELKRLPVVILTSSESKDDVVESYELNSNAYITKPVMPEDFMKLVDTFTDFWFTIVRLPPKSVR